MLLLTTGKGAERGGACEYSRWRVVCSVRDQGGRRLQVVGGGGEEDGREDVSAGGGETGDTPPRQRRRQRAQEGAEVPGQRRSERPASRG